MAAIAVAILLLLALPRAYSQTGAQTGTQTQAPAFNRDVVVLDPAHGGTDSGVKITDTLDEKDVTLDLVARLRSLLIARGFTVVSTRDGSEGAALATDRRAETANKAHAVACLVVHATASGNGVQIGTSTLGSPLAGVPPKVPEAQVQLSHGAVPWDRAQEIYVPQSLRLADKVGAALARSNLPLTVRPVALRPLDNLMCPAISIELAPQVNSGSDPTPVSDATYQQRVADAIAAALVFWRNQAPPPQSIAVPRPDAWLNWPQGSTHAQVSRGSGT